MPHGNDLKERLPVSARNSNARILVVEDDPDVMAYVATVLRAAEFDVLEAPNAEAALATLESRAGIALVVSDIGLPGCLDGVDLANVARQALPGLPVLFMSGNAHGAFEGRGLDPNETDFIAKPFLPHRLLERVQALLPAG